MYIIYTYYYILEGSDEEELRRIVSDIKASGLNITEEVYIKTFLVINIYKLEIETNHLSQTQLIDQIVFDMGLSKSNATPRTNTDLTTNIKGKCQDAERFNQHFHYLSVIYKLNYLENITRPDIAYTVHQ